LKALLRSSDFDDWLSDLADREGRNRLSLWMAPSRFALAVAGVFTLAAAPQGGLLRRGSTPPP